MRRRRRSEPFRLLVFGGSQGAHVFSELVPERAGAASRGEPLAHHGRAAGAAGGPARRRAQRFAGIGVDAEVEPFFTDMGERLADAHLVICRAGASTVAELAVIGRPAILVPYPHALDHDQAENARVLAEAGGAWLDAGERADADRACASAGRLLENAGGAGGRRRCGARARAGSTRPSGLPIWWRALRRSGGRFRPSRSCNRRAEAPGRSCG